MEFLLVPPVAFLIYLAILAGLGRVLRGNTRSTPLYAGGEAHPIGRALPGYRSLFVFALFFAVLHLGGLVLATSLPSPAALLYLAGIALALVALLLG